MSQADDAGEADMDEGSDDEEEEEESDDVCRCIYSECAICTDVAQQDLEIILDVNPNAPPSVHHQL